MSSEYRRSIQDIDDEAARSIGDADILTALEDYVRSQYRKDAMDEQTYDQIMQDIYQLRRRNVQHRDDLARLRKGVK